MSLGACVRYAGYIGPRGYGMRRFKGKLMSAHRAAVLASGQAIPEGMHVLHRCDNRACVRLDHLEVGTPSKNMRDKAMRSPRNSSLKLTPEQVVEIRHMLTTGAVQREIAAQYGVDQSTVSNIKRGKYWSHMEATCP